MTTKSEVTQDDRDAAAREFLDDPDAESVIHDDTAYGLAGDWRILTDDEADEAARRNIDESLWAFTADWIVDYLPNGVGVEVIEALRPQCEGANDAIRAMVGDRFDEMAEDAMSADGRGHFLSSWDGCEHEFQHGGRTWYAYRN